MAFKRVIIGRISLLSWLLGLFMEALTVVGYLLVLSFVPLVIICYWFVQTIYLVHVKFEGYLWIFLCVVVALISLLVFSMCAAKTYSAIQDGVISCIDTNRGHYNDCKSSFELQANPLEFWITLAAQYLITVGFLVLAISCIDLTLKSTIRKT